MPPIPAGVAHSPVRDGIRRTNARRIGNGPNNKGAGAKPAPSISIVDSGCQNL
jgi:hypothetical protein